MIVALFACLAQVPVQLPGNPVTLTCNGAQLNRVVEQLAETSGHTLSVAETMRSEVVVLAVRDLPTKDVLERIATVTEGTWVREAYGWKLVPDRGARSRARLQRIEARLKQLRADVAEKSRPNPHAKAKYEEWNPGVAQLVASLNLEALAAFSAGTRVVYSTHPTPLQRRFVPRAGAVDALLGWLNREGSESLDLPARLSLVVDCNWSGRIDVRVEGFDRFGRSSLMELMHFIDLPSQARAPSAMPSGPTLTVTKLGQEMSGFLNFGDAWRPSPELRSAIRKLDVQEPLAYLVGDALVDAAKHLDVQLVANLPDYIDVPRAVRSGRITLSELMSSLRRDQAVVLRGDKDSLLIQPRDGDESRSTRIDRIAMGRLLKQSPGGSLSWESVADYVFGYVIGDPSTFHQLHRLACIEGGLGFTLLVSHGRELSFYGSLSRQQRAAFEKNGSIRVRDLSPVQRQKLNDLIFHGWEPLISRNPDKEPNVSRERSDSFPNGVTDSMVLRGSTEQRVAFRIPRNEAVAMLNISGTATDIAHSLRAREAGWQDPSKMPHASERLLMRMITSDVPDPRDYSRFEIGTSRTLHMVLDVSANYYVQWSMSDELFEDNAKVYTYATAPTEIREMIDKAKEKLPKITPREEPKRNDPP